MKKTTPIMLLMILLCCVYAKGAELEFTTIAHASTIVSGSDEGGITSRINEVITDPAVLAGYWKTIYRDKEEIPEVPQIDFASEMVIVVSPGPMPTGGYSVQIMKIEDTGSSLEATIVTKKPPPDSFVIQVFTQPYHIVRLARKDLPVVYTWVEE